MDTLEEFIKENGIEFPLVSDSEKEFRKNYGRGRLTYLIDKQGVIQFIQKGVPSNADFLEQLRLLQ
jgi:peroxiredoxin